MMQLTKKLTLVSFAMALFTGPALATEITPEEVAQFSSQKVLLAIESNRDSFANDPEALTEQMLILLEPVVAFDAIANSVMGKYRNSATEAQKERFTEVFKKTMVRLYARALMTFKSEKIEVQPTTEAERTGAARVLMNVTGRDGTVYKVVYNMRKNAEGQWQARNMIVDGINLGMTYLNQFDSAMNRHGDIDKVIATWQQEMSETVEKQTKK